MYLAPMKECIQLNKKKKCLGNIVTFGVASLKQPVSYRQLLSYCWRSFYIINIMQISFWMTKDQRQWKKRVKKPCYPQVPSKTKLYFIFHAPRDNWNQVAKIRSLWPLHCKCFLYFWNIHGFALFWSTNVLFISRR